MIATPAPLLGRTAVLSGLFGWARPGYSLCSSTSFVRSIFVAALALLALVLLPSSEYARADEGSPLLAQCIRALDGDSLILAMSGRRIEVRLIGIDAPERGQPWGRKAWRTLAGLCRANPDLMLEFDRVRRDKYGRTLAYAWTPGKAMLNELLLAAGLALPCSIPPNTAYSSRLEQAAERGRQDGAGFWKQGGLRQTPQEWRKEHPR